MKTARIAHLIQVFLLGLLFAWGSALADIGASGQGTDHAPRPLVIGLTPVFLDDQAAFLASWQAYLADRLGRPVHFVQRNSYAEITELLLRGEIGFAWLCGYPYVRNIESLTLVAVPLYEGKPLYRSYLIVPARDRNTREIRDLRGGVFAYSDPDSNSGYLYPRYHLLTLGESPNNFFGKTFFTWSHRKVIEAVASGLAAGGAVDGYVWDKMMHELPDLTSRTRVVERSPEFGFPPVVAGSAVTEEEVILLREVLTTMHNDPEGLRLLERIHLDGFTPGTPDLYDGIARMGILAGRP